MSEHTHTADVAVAMPAPVEFTDSGRSRKEKNGVFSFFATLWSFILYVKSKIVHGAVIFGVATYSKVLSPLSVFLGSFMNLMAELAESAFHRFRFLSHKAVVSMAGFRKNRFALAAALLSFTLILIASTFYSVGIKLTVNGTDLGYIGSRAEYNEVLRFVEGRASEILERPYSVTQNVRFQVGIVSKEDMLTKEELSSYFFSNIDEVSRLYALTVDGEIIGASTNRETLQNMVDELLYTNDPNVKAHFTQSVQISRRFVDSSKLSSYEEMREKLTSKIHSTKEYTIQSGDTFDEIAKAHGMTSEALKALNPDVNTSRLRVGRKLTVAKEVPFLSVEAVRRVEYTESIPFETKTVEDSSMYTGTSKVVTKGKAGTRKVVADVTYVDNKEESRTIISSTVTAQPVTKVIHKGTKARPKTMATGKLSRPTRGAIISSNYGMRRGSMHKGVDFAAKTGTRISAADGGTVTWAGWKSGGWGYLVVINHGNGIETFYAHNSRVTVRVGQKVAKGEQIAKMGSTGNSSGPHVHFEVHVNGRYVNPWRYIS